MGGFGREVGFLLGVCEGFLVGFVGREDVGTAVGLGRLVVMLVGLGRCGAGRFVVASCRIEHLAFCGQSQ